MGMYTQARGWIYLKEHVKKEQFNSTLKLAEGLSERVNQCIYSTVFNNGFNFESYIFIGGSIKDYDNDWEKYFEFLLESFDFIDYNIELRFEECESWDKFELNK